MAFDPIQFAYTPPPTVEPPSAGTAAAAAASPVGTPAGAPSVSNAQLLIDRLAGMIATSQYLQSLILSQTGSVAVALDPSVNPELAAAAGRIWGQPLPSAITAAMLGRVLDAEFTVMQREMQTPSNSTTEVNPIQAADYALVGKTTESQLIATGDYTSQLPTLLRGLKGDEVVFSSWQHSLQFYPAATGPTTLSLLQTLQQTFASPTDISPPLNAYLNDSLNRFAGVYGRTFNLLTQVGHVEQDLNSVVNHFFTQPLIILKQVVGLLTALRGLQHLPSLDTLCGDLTNFVFVRLLAEVTPMMFRLDKVAQTIVMPFEQSLTSTMQMVNLTRSVSMAAEQEGSQIGGILKGSLKGSSAMNPCSNGNSPTPNGSLFPQPMAGVNQSGQKFNQDLADISKGLQSLSTHLGWSLNKLHSKENEVMLSVRKLMERRMGNKSDQVEILCSLRAVTSLMAMASAFINSNRAGSFVPASPLDQTTSVLNGILSTFSKTTGNSVSLVNSQVVVAQPTIIPPPNAAVINTLALGGIQISTPSSLSSAMGVKL